MSTPHHARLKIDAQTWLLLQRIRIPAEYYSNTQQRYIPTYVHLESLGSLVTACRPTPLKRKGKIVSFPGTSTELSDDLRKDDFFQSFTLNVHQTLGKQADDSCAISKGASAAGGDKNMDLRADDETKEEVSNDDLLTLHDWTQWQILAAKILTQRMVVMRQNLRRNDPSFQTPTPPTEVVELTLRDIPSHPSQLTLTKLVLLLHWLEHIEVPTRDERLPLLEKIHRLVTQMVPEGQGPVWPQVSPPPPSRKRKPAPRVEVEEIDLTLSDDEDTTVSDDDESTRRIRGVIEKKSRENPPSSSSSSTLHETLARILVGVKPTLWFLIAMSTPKLGIYGSPLASAFEMLHDRDRVKLFRMNSNMYRHYFPSLRLTNTLWYYLSKEPRNRESTLFRRPAFLCDTVQLPQYENNLQALLEVWQSLEARLMTTPVSKEDYDAARFWRGVRTFRVTLEQGNDSQIAPQIAEFMRMSTLFSKMVRMDEVSDQFHTSNTHLPPFDALGRLPLPEDAPQLTTYHMLIQTELPFKSPPFLSLPSLTSLELFHSGWNTRPLDVEPLVLRLQLQGLRRLCLYGFSIDAAPMVTLINAIHADQHRDNGFGATLTYLDLQENNLSSPEVIVALAQCVQQATVLREMHLGQKSFHNAGEQFVLLAQAVRLNQSLETVSFANENHLGEADFRAVSNSIGQDGSIIPPHPRLRHLSMYDWQDPALIAVDWVNLCRAYPLLESLDVGGPLVLGENNEYGRRLVHLPLLHLHHLSFRMNTQVFLPLFATPKERQVFAGLWTLVLSNTRLIATVARMKHFFEIIKTVKDVDISRTQVGLMDDQDALLPAVDDETDFDSWSPLTVEWDADEQPMITPHHIEYYLLYMLLGPSSTKCQIHTLRWCTMSKSVGVSILLQALANNLIPSLKNFNSKLLMDRSNGHARVEEITDMLRTNTSLEQLYLGGVNITGDWMDAASQRGYLRELEKLVTMLMTVNPPPNIRLVSLGEFERNRNHEDTTDFETVVDELYKTRGIKVSYDYTDRFVQLRIPSQGPAPIRYVREYENERRMFPERNSFLIRGAYD